MGIPLLDLGAPLNHLSHPAQWRAQTDMVPHLFSVARHNFKWPYYFGINEVNYNVESSNEQWQAFYLCPEPFDHSIH